MNKEDLKVLDGGVSEKTTEVPKVAEPNKKVSRQELAEVIAQLGDNVGQVQEGLVEAVAHSFKETRIGLIEAFKNEHDVA